MAGAGRPPVRREDDIVRDLHAERERFVAVLEDLGDEIHAAAEHARLRAREGARKAAPAALATAALLLATMLVRRRRRDGRR